MNETTRRRRPWLIVSIVVVAVALISLMAISFNDALVYFFTPAEIQTSVRDLAGQKIRIGGMVKEGSLIREPDSSKIAFIITDGEASIPTRYEGIVPDLFREGQGVVAEGIWHPGKTFQADVILAKHSEDYIPVEMSKEGIDKSRESLLRSLQ